MKNVYVPRKWDNIRNADMNELGETAEEVDYEHL